MLWHSIQGAGGLVGGGGGAEGWDISTASYVQSFSVATYETSPAGLFFKPDGTKMYVVGYSSDAIQEYDLSSAWDISTASRVKGLSVSGRDTIPVGLFFKPDGTKMYFVGNSGDSVYEYNLPSAWTVSPTSYVQNFSVASRDTAPQDVFFKPDGTKMYVMGGSNGSVYEYDLSSAWNISTASYVQSFSVATYETLSRGLFFKPDGTKMYFVGSSGDSVYEYDLSSAWDISTASYVQNFSVASQDGSPQAVFFKPDGTKMYVVGSLGDSVYEYDLSS